MKKSFTLLVLALSAVFMVGCATDINSQSYSDEHVGEASRSYRGRVLKVRKVKVGPDELGKSKAGAIAGGIGGAMIGSTMGRGTGNAIMTGVGAIAGAVGGAYAEKALKTQKAYEITVELKNEELLTVVQGTDVKFRRGEPVIVMVSQRGRSKVMKESDF